MRKPQLLRQERDVPCIVVAVARFIGVTEEELM
jgi:hypothetical protein